jgi:uncharacterized membrane protein
MMNQEHTPVWRVCLFLLSLLFPMQTSADDADMPTRQYGQTYVFVCNEPKKDTFQFTYRVMQEKIALWLPWRFGYPYLVLEHVPSASGAKYEGEGILVWNKGNNALLQVKDKTFTGCLLDRKQSIWEHAKLDGVDFRAVGNEPGWHLELRMKNRIDFVHDYGQKKISVPAPEPVTNQQSRSTRFDSVVNNDRVTVLLEGKRCFDSMSGEAFETTVTVILNDHTYRGCGRALH